MSKSFCIVILVKSYFSEKNMYFLQIFEVYCHESLTTTIGWGLELPSIQDNYNQISTHKHFSSRMCHLSNLYVTEIRGLQLLALSPYTLITCNQTFTTLRILMLQLSTSLSFKTHEAQTTTSLLHRQHVPTLVAILGAKFKFIVFHVHGSKPKAKTFTKHKLRKFNQIEKQNSTYMKLILAYSRSIHIPNVSSNKWEILDSLMYTQ